MLRQYIQTVELILGTNIEDIFGSDVDNIYLGKIITQFGKSSKDSIINAFDNASKMMDDDTIVHLFKFVYLLKKSGIDANTLRKVFENSSLAIGCDLTTSQKDLEVITMILKNRAADEIENNININYFYSLLKSINKYDPQLTKELSTTFKSVNRVVATILPPKITT